MLGEALVALDHLRKTFPAASRPALDGVSLQVAPGQVFGVIGRSGAGKSTLIRCVNLLERPDGGSVRVDGREMTTLSQTELAQARGGIGMVFQHFNILARRTVAENVALPLEIMGLDRSTRDARAAAVLALVGLSDKAAAYPAQLSGGQKQRVGVARALATSPKLLLCDEATSALDPEATADILALLRSLRDRLGLTILLITHEMAVVKDVCDEVAVLDAGRIIEQGRVFDVFTQPRTALARRFVGEVVGDAIPPGTLARLPAPSGDEALRVLRVLFAGQHATRAVISEATRRFGIDLNIISGRIDAIGGEPFGIMALACYGPPTAIAGMVAWMQGLGLLVEDA